MEGGVVQHKLTVDGGLMREHVLAPAVAILKNWQLEGKIEIIESDRSATANQNPGWPGAPRGTSEKSSWAASRGSRRARA